MPEALNFVEEHKAMGLLGAIALAEYRCLPTNQLASRLARVWELEDADILLRQLRERTLEDADVRVLVDVVGTLSIDLEELSTRERRACLRAIKRIVKLLPPDEATQIAGRFLDHRWKLGREIAYEGYKVGSLPQDRVGAILDHYTASGDQGLLELVARQRSEVPTAVAEILLDELEEPYWRGRVMAAVLEVDCARARILSTRFPREYAHAVGRLRARAELAHLVQLFSENGRNFDFLHLYAYALGKLGRVNELLELRGHVKSMLAAPVANSPAQHLAPAVEAPPRG